MDPISGEFSGISRKFHKSFTFMGSKGDLAGLIVLQNEVYSYRN